MVESTLSLRNRMKALLESKGYIANCYDVSRHALDEIAASREQPYTVVISSYMMPRMKGDEILKNVREISPETQRLLIADTADFDTMISAVNQASIHACLTLPFEDENFLLMVDQCTQRFENSLKQENLTRITKRQNKQLFKIASNFKKKEAQDKRQQKRLNKEIRVLESRIRSAGGIVEQDETPMLDQILHLHGTGLTQDDLSPHFSVLKKRIREIFETAAQKEYVTIREVPYEEVVTISMIDHEHQDLAKKVFWPVIANILSQVEQPGAAVSGSKQIQSIVLEDFLDLSLNDDETRAFIKVRVPDTEALKVAHVRQFLEKNKIINGVIKDKEMKIWLDNATPEDKPFLVAKGRPAVQPTHASIRYHFKTDFLHAGKINEDGSINFQDRGEIPYVEEGTFLAAKIAAREGRDGVSVMGKEIPVEEVEDITFSAGPGTRISEDGVRIYATTAGQPHLDAMGNISVCPEYQIKGDIGFETGDVNFDGNVVVNGAVKQGFKVTCASLTAREIQGAEIDIAGDLNVSMGIMDTELVKVKGNVQAKFVRNSKINAFGDLIIQKEIVDSKIYLSGACVNSNGSIIHSEISAKRGIDAGTIGNKSSKPSVLTVGVDENTNLLVARVDSKLNINNTAIRELSEEIKVLEKEDQDFHAVIAQHAHVQDRSQLELKDIEKKMADLKASGNMAAFQKVSKTVEGIREKAMEAEKKINEGFERQDEIELEISQKRGRINEFLESNKALEDEKKRLREFSLREAPLPEVKIGKKVESGTKVFSENASLTIYKTASRCKIMELAKSSDGVGGITFYDMEITPY